MKHDQKEAINYAIQAIKIRISTLPKKRPGRKQLWERAWAYRHMVELEQMINKQRPTL